MEQPNHEMGDGVPNDETQTRKWLKMAAAQGNVQARKLLDDKVSVKGRSTFQSEQRRGIHLPDESFNNKWESTVKHFSLLLVGGVILMVFSLSYPCLAWKNVDPYRKTVVDGNTKFACDLYQGLKETEENLFLSPYSISAALSMAYAGARDHTAKQMAETMHFSLKQKKLHSAFGELRAALTAVQQKGNVTLHVANSLWPQKEYPFLRDYIRLVKNYYGALISPVDYEKEPVAAAERINTWVEEKTNKKIRDIIQPQVLDAFTRLILVNAIYFKGNWAMQFMEEATHDAPFHLSQKEFVRVPMMNQIEFFRYAESENSQILELPYIGHDLSMLVLLPKKVDGLAYLEKSLTAENLERWWSLLHNKEVNVSLPKFTMTSQFSLGDRLQSMGMRDAFNPDRADFSGMDGNPDWLYLTNVIHKAFVDVNEEGTEATAATAITVDACVSGPPPVIFRADHPFVFLIRDKTTGSLLFIGRVVNPAKS
jgi:serine protease inhibitor